MTLAINVTKRTRKRRMRSGETVLHIRYVLNYKDPQSGKRRQEFFERHKDALERRNEVITQVAEGSYADRRTSPTVADAIDHWLATKEGQVKENTVDGYKVVVEHIRGPFLVGSARDRALYTHTGQTKAGQKLLPMLGDIKLPDLTTAQIRAWHRTLSEEAGSYTANRAISHLRAILALAEEDYRIRAPSMPTSLPRGRHRPKKAILTPDQIGRLVEAARNDKDYGVYYAFPFLVGTRPSEQLGLLWEDLDFGEGLIRIQRIQERDGSLTPMTKTEAGTREVPISPVLREMLLAWRVVCPRLCGELHRVFPGPGRLQPWPKPRKGGGGPLLYQNFRKRIWVPAFERLELPYVTPHSARHSFISVLQAKGIEVGLVAKLAGHSSAVVTLGHYTQAVRGGHEALEALESAYRAAS